MSNLTYVNTATGDLPSQNFLGSFSSSNPSSNSGQWWYRTDTGQIMKNVNGNIIAITPPTSVLVISTNQTIGSTSTSTMIDQNI
ncbi:MAG: hypothetical protein ACP5RZ_06425, partial [Thermoplasmata archaeon]